VKRISSVRIDPLSAVFFEFLVKLEANKNEFCIRLRNAGKGGGEKLRGKNKIFNPIFKLIV
jgi:hypothetical protein